MIDAAEISEVVDAGQIAVGRQEVWILGHRLVEQARGFGEFVSEPGAKSARGDDGFGLTVSVKFVRLEVHGRRLFDRRLLPRR